MLHALRHVLLVRTLGHRRHIRYIIAVIRVRGRLRHAELLLEALLLDAGRLLVDPRVDGAEAGDGGARRHEAVTASGDGEGCVAAGVVGRLGRVGIRPAEARGHGAAVALALGGGGPVREELAEGGGRGEGGELAGLRGGFEGFFFVAQGAGVLG